MVLYSYLLNVPGSQWHLMSKVLFYFSLKSSVSFLVPFFFLIRKMMGACELKR